MEHIKTFFESLMEGNYIKAVDSIKVELDSRSAVIKQGISETVYTELGFKKKVEEAKDEDEDKDKKDDDKDDEDEPSDKKKDDKKSDSDEDED